MKTTRYNETHSAGARHATAWLNDTDMVGTDWLLTGSEALTLAVVACLADSDLFTPNGYFGISAEEVSRVVRVSTAAATRRLDRLAEVGALDKRKVYGNTYRYWIPEEVRLP